MAKIAFLFVALIAIQVAVGICACSDEVTELGTTLEKPKMVEVVENTIEDGVVLSCLPYPETDALLLLRLSHGCFSTDLKMNHIEEIVFKNILETLQHSLKEDTSKSFRGMFDFLRELKEKLDSLIDLVSNLPSNIEEIYDKLNKIISTVNISVLYTQLKIEVQDIISNGGPEAQRCLPEADKQLNIIAQNAEDSQKICMIKSEGQIEDIQAKFENLVQEANNLLFEMNQNINNCLLDNKLNPTGFAKCIDDLVDEYKIKITDFQQKVGEIVEETRQQGRELLEIFARCLNNVQLDTIQKGQILISSIEKCVSNSHPLS